HMTVTDAAELLLDIADAFRPCRLARMGAGRQPRIRRYFEGGREIGDRMGVFIACHMEGRDKLMRIIDGLLCNLYRIIRAVMAYAGRKQPCLDPCLLTRLVNTCGNRLHHILVTEAD